MPVILGIDPGASGGLAWITMPSKDMPYSKYGAIPMPSTELDILEWIYTKKPDEGENHDTSHIFAVIEKVGGFMGGMRKDSGGDDSYRRKANVASGHTMFQFGQNYGTLRTSLHAVGIPFDEVLPKTWQKFIGVVKQKGEDKTSWKNRLKAKAQQLFPNIHVTLATADALLIARYALLTGGHLISTNYHPTTKVY